ncbi:MAG: hypothetical protein U1C51_09695 [Candidatus Izemoplasmatales bacterium]|nr:hypothetical protein [bacterium]MDZ4197501.1 hypothetical protein [Candidatus Izemoplasmatales bacterium]
MILATTLEIILEITLLLIVLSLLAGIASVFVVRNLRKTYKELFRSQSKFDIELRKAANLLSKVVKSEELKSFQNRVIKELPYVVKKHLLDIVDEAFTELDLTNELYSYLVETYENLQESRRVLDAKILLFNQKISFFPFSLYAKIMKFKKHKYYTNKI